MSRDPAIAIIGIGCRFPGGVDSPAGFWDLLCRGIDAITEIPRQRFDLDALYAPSREPGKLYVRWGGFVEGIDRFDADFFGISPREARRMDPQHRLLLEVVWEALEDAGQIPKQLAGTRTGVFIGTATHDYSDLQFDPRHRHLLDGHANVGAGGAIAANRVSYQFDLRGPSIMVDTACSGSLVAVHLACRSLVSGEVDLAIAGGANAFLTPEPAIGFCQAGMLSPTGRCRAFDAGADGFVRAEGAAVVLLKPLSNALADGDPIHAVIRGTAVNQDGRTVGIMVPNPDAQIAMLREALRVAELEPSDIQYVEAHGTGTVVGDPIEAAAIGAVFSQGRAPDAPCLIGSVKTGIGHLEAAAGIAGLIKTILALRHRQIPPHLHLERVNPAIDLQALGLRIPTALEPWPATSGPARAGVNSFGFGGSNAHVLLEEPPRVAESAGVEPREAPCILTISARTPAARQALGRAFSELLHAAPEPRFADVCWVAAARRTHHEHRLAVAAASRAECLQRLDAFLEEGSATTGVAVGTANEPAPKLAFVFPGMGAQWPRMTRELLEQEPVYREVIERCDVALRRWADWSLCAELEAADADSRIADADRAQVVNFTVQAGLVALWRSWGIVPDAVIGHSAGEVSAAFVAGALDLEDAVLAAWHRGRLQHRATGTGTMLAVGVPVEEAEVLIAASGGLASIAAVNGPASLTLSGAVDALEQIAATLEARQRFCRFLPVAVPYHGPQMDAIEAELLASLEGLTPRETVIPIVSTVTGRWAGGGSFDAGYWWRNVRRTVRFAAGFGELLSSGYDTFIEVSAHPVLAASMRDCIGRSGRSASLLPTLRRKDGERATMLASLAELYARGRTVDWSGVFPGRGHPVPLPCYPWQRERHWFLPEGDGAASSSSPSGRDTGHPLLGRRLHAAQPVWEQALSASRLRYLEGHRIEGDAVLPAAAYIELALAAAREVRQAAPVLLEQVEFRQLLPLSSRDDLVVQCAYAARDRALEIHAARPVHNASWTLHARANIGSPGNAAAAAVDFAAIRARCATERSALEYYRSLAASGYEYGGEFRGIAALWVGRGEALGRIEARDDAHDAGRYAVHPALLDSAFQMLLAAVDSSDSRGSPPASALLPVRLDRVVWHRSPGAAFWAHATIEQHDSRSIVARIDLLDDDGAVVCRCDGLRLQRVHAAATRAAADRLDLLYDVRWEPVAADGADGMHALDARRLLQDVRPAVSGRAAQERWSAYYDSVDPCVEALALHAIRTGFAGLGVDGAGRAEMPADALGEELGVIPRHRRYFARLLEVRRAHDQAGASNGGSNSALPRGAEQAELSAVLESATGEFRGDGAPLVRLLTASGERLAAVLTGRLDPLQALFTPESLADLAAFYEQSWTSRHANTVMREIIAAVRRRTRGPLRILEVGAGTGGTTRWLLPALADGSTEYVFSDVSPYFLTLAQQRLGGFPQVRFERLDLEEPFEERGFDVLIAAHVLHATADLRSSLRNARRLLRPGGLFLLLEPTRPALWLDLLFGGLEGWWRFTDRDVRPDHPLLRVEQWHSLLEESGFTGVRSIATEFGGEAPLQAVFLAQSSTRASDRPEQGASERAAAPFRTGAGDAPAHWLILADAAGVGEKVASALAGRGSACRLIRRDGRASGDGGGPQAAPGSVDDWVRLLAPSAADPRRLTGVLHLWSLDAPPAEGLSTARLMDHERMVCASVRDLVRAVAALHEGPELCFVTAGAHAVRGDAAPPHPARSSVWGLVRVAMREYPELRCRLVDLGSDPGGADAAVDALAEDLLNDATRRECALRGDQRFVPSLTPMDATPWPEGRVVRAAADASFRVEVVSPGLLETLVLREAAVARPGPREVIVRVRAASLNFRDVLVALGTYPGSTGRETLGCDCAGVVVECGDGVAGLRRGDEVIAMVAGAFASHVTIPAEHAVKKPAELTFAEAASIPAAFLTAHYALNHAARLGAGERVLIHAATGGVGLAAIQLAQQRGAEVFATAGSPGKRAYLRALGIRHVMDSRTLAFADEVLANTGGEGVDVVLNALAGEAIHKGLAILRSCGRFVEIGKRDIHEHARLDLSPFERSLTFAAFDLFEIFRQRPGWLLDAMRQLVGRIAAGELRLPPIRTFGFEDIEAAFRFVAGAKHIGKVVLTAEAESYRLARSGDAPLFHADATYLITGGLGGFALSVAGWLVERGARHLVLVGRRGVPADPDRPALDALRRGPAAVRIVRADAADENDVARLLDDLRRDGPPLRGVFHAAMLLEDAPIEELDDARLHAVLAPKVAGAWNLHRLTASDPLDCFVLFSSLASLVGPVKQGSYAAANAFLDGLASHRHALGLPALAVNWGAIADVGYVSRHPEIARYLEREGLARMTPADALAALERLLRQGRPQAAAMRIDWSRVRDADSLVGSYAATLATSVSVDPGNGSRPAAAPSASASLLQRLIAAPAADRPALLESDLVVRAARALATSAAKIEAARPLPELGFDSLCAVELQSGIELDLGIRLGVTKLLQGLNLREIAALLLEQLALPAEQSQPVTSSNGGTGAVPENARGVASLDHPLSHDQRRFWLIEQLHPGSPINNLHGALRLRGALDVAALERGIDEVVRRHDALRSRLRVVDGEPRQYFAPGTPRPLPVIDLGRASLEKREAELQRVAGAEVRRAFDLSADPLLRACLIRLGESEHVLLVTAHHIASGPWSIPLLLHEVATLYADFRSGRTPSLPPPRSRYLDFVTWQQERLEPARIEQQKNYWRQQLGDAEPAVRLPADRPRPAVPGFRGRHLTFELSRGLTNALVELSRNENVTLFMTLMAAHQALLQRWAGQDDVSVGTAIASWGAAAEQRMIGCFVNSLVVRTDLSGEPTFRELLQRVRAVALAAYENRDLPFEQVIEAVQPPRGPGLSPLFNTMLVLHAAAPEVRMPGLVLERAEIESGTALFDLMLVIEQGERLRGTLEYSTDLFEPATAARLLAQFQLLLEAVAADADRPIAALPIATTSERHRVTVEFNRTAVDFGPERCLHDLVADQIERTPDATALVLDRTQLTYRELQRRAERIGRRLKAAGVGPEQIVGVCAGRSFDLVAALLGVLEAGGAFLLLDPTLPQARLSFMLEDAGVKLLLANENVLQNLPPSAAQVLVLDGGASPSLHTDRAGEPRRSATPGNPAYVIYTSGSTGHPKGVVVEHRAICNQVRWRQQRFPLAPSDAVLQRTPLGFDPAIWELFGPLATGARLVLASPDRDNDARYLTELMARHGITTLQVVPSLLDVLLEEPGLRCCRSLKRVFCGGEPLSAELQQRFFRALRAELHNLYGPTETTIDATCWTCAEQTEEAVVPIGRPVANAVAYVLSDAMEPAPVGAAGELYIGGAGVARGYVGGAAREEARFVANPFGAGGGRLFRTGDLARWRADGNLEFLGRRDRQLKIRGMRVEPDEVEAVLLRHPQVRRAAAVADGERDGRGRLIAFVVTAGEESVDSRELIDFVSRHLPKYMVPSAVIGIDELPRTHAGKIDRARLARHRVSAERDRQVVPPRDAMERQLLRIWEDLLDTRPIGVTDDFFALGGHSLAAMRLVVRIEQEHGRRLPVSCVADSPTIELLARRLQGIEWPTSPLVVLQSDGGGCPFFCVHPAGGTVLCYADLAGALGSDRPFIAVQSPALNGGDDSVARIEEIASRHLEYVRGAQAAGPYLLGGWSMGGVIAYEMARQLEESGSGVAALCLIDPAPPTWDPRQPEGERECAVRAFLLNLGLAPDDLTRMVPHFWQLDERDQVSCVVEHARRGGLLPPDLEPAALRRALDVFAAHSRALRDHVPRPYAGRVDVFAASDAAGAASARGWKALGGDVRIQSVPGDHYAILRAPHVEQLARALISRLRAAEGEHAAGLTRCRRR